MALLRVVGIEDASGEVTSYPLGKRETTLGRAETCGIVLPDRGISRRHARLVPTPHGYLIEDDGSSTGVFVNGVRVSRHLLSEGDLVRLGGTTLEFSDRSPRGPVPAPPIVPAVLLLGSLAVLTLSLAIGLALWVRGRGTRASVQPIPRPSPVVSPPADTAAVDAEVLLALAQEYLQESRQAPDAEAREAARVKAVDALCWATDLAPQDARIRRVLADAQAGAAPAPAPSP